jgi:hypothetical protein
MREEASSQDLKIREVDTRIETEIANLRTAIQASKVSRFEFGIVGPDFGKRLQHFSTLLVSVSSWMFAIKYNLTWLQ